MHLLEHEKDLWTLGDELTLTAGVELGNQETLSVYLTCVLLHASQALGRGIQQSVQCTVSKFSLTHLMLHFLQEGLEQLRLLGQGCLLAWWRGIQFYFQCCRQL